MKIIISTYRNMMNLREKIIHITRIEIPNRDFWGGAVVKTLPSNADGVGSIPGQGAKIPHASWPRNQNIKQKWYCNKFNKDFKNGPLKKKRNIMQKYTERKHFQDSESPSFQKGNKNLIVLEKDKARIQAHRNFQKFNLNFGLYRDPAGKKLGYLDRFKKKKKKAGRQRWG